MYFILFDFFFSLFIDEWWCFFLYFGFNDYTIRGKVLIECGLLFSGNYLQQLDFIDLYGTTVGCNTENHKWFRTDDPPVWVFIFICCTFLKRSFCWFFCILSFEFFLFSYLLLTFLWEYMMMTFVLLYIFLNSMEYFVLKVKWLYCFVNLSLINHIVRWKAFYLLKINVIYHLLLIYLNCDFQCHCYVSF